MTSGTSLKYRIEAYRGEEPYAFVSYAHEDAGVVSAELAALIRLLTVALAGAAAGATGTKVFVSDSPGTGATFGAVPTLSSNIDAGASWDAVPTPPAIIAAGSGGSRSSGGGGCGNNSGIGTSPLQAPIAAANNPS